MNFEKILNHICLYSVTFLYFLLNKQNILGHSPYLGILGSPRFFSCFLKLGLDFSMHGIF